MGYPRKPVFTIFSKSVRKMLILLTFSERRKKILRQSPAEPCKISVTHLDMQVTIIIRDFNTHQPRQLRLRHLPMSAGVLDPGRTSHIFEETRYVYRVNNKPL